MKHLEPIQKTIDETIEKLCSDIDNIKLIADNAFKLAQENQKVISQLRQENNALKNQLADNKTHINLLEEKIESRTNRQLRKTLVFKGIPEKTSPPKTSGSKRTGENKQKTGESWDDTRKLLADKIANICVMRKEDASRIIERCHRSNNSKNYKGTGPRPIFAAFFDWNDSEWVKSEFRKNNINDPSCRTYAEQKFGPFTTMRRSQALLLRKKLKEEGTIVSGYVSFPAKLMVKKPGGENYYLEKDFSQLPVNSNS